MRSVLSFCVQTARDRDMRVRNGGNADLRRVNMQLSHGDHSFRLKADLLSVRRSPIERTGKKSVFQIYGNGIVRKNAFSQIKFFSVNENIDGRHICAERKFRRRVAEAVERSRDQRRAKLLGILFLRRSPHAHISVSDTHDRLVFIKIPFVMSEFIGRDDPIFFVAFSAVVDHFLHLCNINIFVSNDSTDRSKSQPKSKKFLLRSIFSDGGKTVSDQA